MKLPIALRLLKDRYFGEASRDPSAARRRLEALSRHLEPEQVQVISDVIERLIRYQDADYAILYLDRIGRYVGPGKDFFPFLGELLPRLDERMRYLDPPSAAQNALGLAGAQERPPGGEPVKFCLTDLVGMLPPSGADPLLPVLNYRHWSKREVALHFAGHSRWSRIWAFLRHARTYSRRFKNESAWVERWLHMIDRVRVKQPEAALAVIRSADLIKGSGHDYHRGLENWHAIIDRLVKPACDGTLHLVNLGEAIRIAVNHAMNDVDCAAFNRIIGGIAGGLNDKPLSA